MKSDLFKEGNNAEYSVHATIQRDLSLRSINTSNSFRSDETQGVSVKSIRKAKNDGQSQGTLMGVFFPCIQNIVGVILFMRLTWVTAQAGVFYSIVILLLCSATALLSTLSLSALATNGRIPGGGPYYVISRNLGLEIGSSVGIIYYLGTSLAGSMYILGAVEAFQTSFDLRRQFSMDMQLQSIILSVLLASIVFVGVKYVNMAGSVFLAIVFVSIISAVAGLLMIVSGSSDSLLPEQVVYGDNSGPNYEIDTETGNMPTFTSLISLVYPAVTGFLAGTNRSGVLENPGRSIPKGTIYAILVATAIYSSFIWMFGSTISNETLKENKMIVSMVSWPHPKVVSTGIIFSSIGAGLQSLTGAPQLLAAIAKDDVIPFLRFARVENPGDEPRKAVLVTWIIAALPCLAGNLDYISPAVTMFNLLMYGTINLACFVLAILKTPGFRPKWRYFHWSTALLGVLWCVGLMILINPMQACLSTLFAFGLWLYASSKKAKKEWGSAGQGIKYQLAHKTLLSLNQSSVEDAKNYRPQLMVFCKMDENGELLDSKQLEFAGQLKKGRGFLEVVSFLHTKTKNDAVEQMNRCSENSRTEMNLVVENSASQLSKTMDRLQIRGFSRVIPVSKDQYFDAMMIAIQSSGIGALQCNTVQLGWLATWRKKMEINYEDGYAEVLKYVDTLQRISDLKKATIILKGGSKLPSNNHRVSGFIDIWWILHDGGLLLLIPYLLKLHKVWKKCTIRLFTVATEEENSIEIKRRLEMYLERLRISAVVQVVEMNGSDISPLANQRTIDMIQRRELLKGMTQPTLTIAARNTDVELIKGSSVYPSLATPSTKSKHTNVHELFPIIAEDEEMGYGNGSDDSPQQQNPTCVGEICVATTDDILPSTTGAVSTKSLKQNNIERHAEYPVELDAKRMEHAIKIRNEINRHSKDALLVIMNLPRLKDCPPTDFMEYVEVLTEDLYSVALLRGSGREIVTTFA